MSDFRVPGYDSLEVLWISLSSDQQTQKCEASPSGRRSTQGVVLPMPGLSYIDHGGVLQTVHQNKTEEGEMTVQSHGRTILSAILVLFH